MEPAFTSRRAAPGRPPVADALMPDALMPDPLMPDVLMPDTALAEADACTPGDATAAAPHAGRACADGPDLAAAFEADLAADRAAAAALSDGASAPATPAPAPAGDAASTDTASAVLPLPPRLDTRAATALAAALLQRRGTPLRLDGSAVAFVGASCAQVLIAARESWRRDGLPFAVVPGGGLADGLRTLGLDDMIPTEEATG